MTTRFAPRLPTALFLSIALLAVLAPSRVVGQSTGTLLVTVRKPDSTPLPGAFVRFERVGAAADQSGQARLELPARLVTVRVSHPGYDSRRFDITILPAVAQRFELTLEPMGPARVPRAGRSSPAGTVAVGVVAGPELDRQTMSHPADLTRTLEALPGADVLGTSGPLNPARLWADGVPGHLTAVLVDGLPAAGGAPSGFDLFQFSPLEFEQVELLRGPATAYYGAAAPGSVVNLVPRRVAGDEVRFAINQSSEKGGDLMLWAGRRHSPELSASLFADFHQQRLVDSDDDGWGEFPRAIRFSIRPRLYFDRPNGDGASLSAGFHTEDRTGGFLLVNTGDDIYREERRVRRFDGSFSARRSLGGQGLLRFRLATVLQTVAYRFDELLEHDRRSTVGAEATWQDVVGGARLLAGVGYYRDALRQRDLPAFDYTHEYPSAFGSVEVAPAAGVHAAIAGRCDAHNLHGTQCAPRVDLLLSPSAETELRFHAAGGYLAPVPLFGDGETIGAKAFFPVATRAERTAAAGVEVRWRRDAVSLTGVVEGTRIGNPVRIVPIPGDPAARLRLLNLTEPTRILSLDLTAGYTAGRWTVGGSYGLRTGSEGLDDNSGRRSLSVVPRHRLGGSLGWASGTGTVVDGRVTYFGSRNVVDNPLRTTTPGFAVLDGLVSQRSGRTTLYLSVENLFDVKLGGYEPVFFTTPGPGGSRTATPWAPLRGRVLSLGAMVDWRR